MIDFDIVDIPTLKVSFDAAQERLVAGLRGASLSAAAAGILAARRDHSYTDRTFNLSGEGDGGSETNSHAEQQQDGTAVMVWPVRYASFIDKGTRRNLAYPFTPQAEYAAEKELNLRAEEVLEDTSSRF